MKEQDSVSEEGITDAITQGQALHIAGDLAGAQAHYKTLWDEATPTANHYEASIAPHFLAHAQTEPDAPCEWHERALYAAE